MQSRRMSAVEAFANVAIGFGVSWTANLVILPAYGYHVSGGQAFSIGLWFMAISIARSYAVRRLFCRLPENRPVSNDDARRHVGPARPQHRGTTRRTASPSGPA